MINYNKQHFLVFAVSMIGVNHEKELKIHLLDSRTSHRNQL
jgi:hypothetical protein